MKKPAQNQLLLRRPHTNTNLLNRMYYTLSSSSIFVKHTNLYNIEYVSSEGKRRCFGRVNTLFSIRGTRRVTHVKQIDDKSYSVM